MTVASVLVVARNEYDAGNIDNQGFADAVNGILNSVATAASDAEKIAAFDSLAETLSRLLQIHELENGIQYVRSGNDHTVFEAAVSNVLGEDIWDGFYNKTYESC